MADVTVTFDISESMANALPLRSTDDGEGNRTFETVNEYAKRCVEADGNIRIVQDRQRKRDSLTDEQLDAAVALAEKAR